MKIGILTFPGSPSHGASLQMFGLYHTLIKKGFDVEIINYIPKNVIHRRSVNQKITFKGLIKSKITSLYVKSSRPFFDAFEKQLIKYPSEPIETTDEMKALVDRYDRIIVGSDQVWNPVVTGNDMNYYLAFSDKKEQKASYAPSFGNISVAKDDEKKITELLDDFSYLCAREKQGANIIESLIGKSVPVVIDPSMFVSANVWRDQAKNVKIPKGKYVLFYNIKPSLKLKSIAQKFADKNGLKLITIGGRLREFIDKTKHPVSGIGPAEFLWLIDNAEYVFTNSFHGTAFSIIFHKNFYVEYSSDTNSRLTNIIDTFMLSDCVVSDDILEKPTVNVDYTKVDEILKKQQAFSLNYLNSVVEEQ